MTLRIVGVFQELSCDTLCIDAGSHAVVAFVAQYTYQLSGQCFFSSLMTVF